MFGRKPRAPPAHGRIQLFDLRGKMVRFNFLRLMLLLCSVMATTNAEVAYTVYTNECGANAGRELTTVMNPQVQAIGTCQNHGKGADYYNSIQVLSCTDTCLCFKQFATPEADMGCNESSAVGFNIKMSCFNKCLQDCNGNNCGDTALPGSSVTRLQLTGSGQICKTPVSEEDFICLTTGMIKDSNGKIVDDFATTSTTGTTGTTTGTTGTSGAAPTSGCASIALSIFLGIALAAFY